MSVRAKKFRPPLKNSTVASLSPVLSPAHSSQWSGSNSLPDTQTHTVLSYCDNYQEEPASSDDHSPSEESEAESEVPVSRFKRHSRHYPLPIASRSYGYHGQSKRRATVADIERNLGQKRVCLPPVRKVRVGQCGGDLSVYDCQPTPPEAVGVVNSHVTSPQSRAKQVSQLFV